MCFLVLASTFRVKCNSGGSDPQAWAQVEGCRISFLHHRHPTCWELSTPSPTFSSQTEEGKAVDFFLWVGVLESSAQFVGRRSSWCCKGGEQVPESSPLGHQCPPLIHAIGAGCVAFQYPGQCIERLKLPRSSVLENCTCDSPSISVISPPWQYPMVKWATGVYFHVSGSVLLCLLHCFLGKICDSKTDWPSSSHFKFTKCLFAESKCGRQYYSVRLSMIPDKELIAIAPFSAKCAGTLMAAGDCLGLYYL